MIRNVDKNSNGAIDFNEFIEMMLRRDSKIEEDVLHAFRVFDRDGDGLSDYSEIEVHGTDIDDADSDGDGFTDTEEVLATSDPLSSESTPENCCETGEG